MMLGLQWNYIHMFFCIALFQNPAPGQYSPEKVHPQGEPHAPCYSMSSRTKYRKSELYVTCIHMCYA